MVVERIRAFDVTAVRSGKTISKGDRVVIEEPLEIRLDGSPLAVVMRTPGHDVELAAGLLRAEELVSSSEDFVAIAHCAGEDNILDVVLARKNALQEARAKRSLLTSSSCGVCGKRTIESLQASAPPFESTPKIDLDLVRGLPDSLRAAQAVFAETGGLHAAAIFDEQGRCLVLREDVGRHNAVDKCCGFLLLRNALPGAMLMVSGRVSFEIVQKALVSRIPLIAAVSAPSSLAIELARASNMALCGFVRGGDLNVYCGAF